MELNYYAINKIVGGVMKPARSPRFGGFGLLQTTAEILRHQPRKAPTVHFTRDMDRRIVEAFETMRVGRAPDAILWDKTLAACFYDRCREFGLHAPSAQLGSRLIHIRKSPKHYAKYGIRLSPTTVAEPRASIVWRYAHAIEFALVTLRYRHGVSIDDILLDPNYADSYEELARGIASGMSSEDLRLGALYIRKTRHLARDDQSLFEEMDAASLEERFVSIGTLAHHEHAELHAAEGLIEIAEPKRVLYITRTSDVRGTIQGFGDERSLKVMSNPFWRPDPSRIGVRVLSGSKFYDIGIQKWQLKLLAQKRPVLNWPVSGRAA